MRQTGRNKKQTDITLTTSAKSAKPNSYCKYYFFKGRKLGILGSWSTAEEQMTGFSCSVYQSFKTKRTAEEFLRNAGIRDVVYYTRALVYVSIETKTHIPTC